MTDAAQDFRGQLNRQLGFLSRSCEAYDLGHNDEAIRVATTARILLHQTRTSTSLLQHLNATTISLLTTTRGASSTGIVHFVGMGLFSINSDSGSSYKPKLGAGSYTGTLPVSEWWVQVVMVIDGHHISRRALVLAAANKDGGAHVDSSLTPEYEALSKGGAVGSIVHESPESYAEYPITDAHLVSLRQIGYELLNSPQLLGLAHG